MTRLSDYIFRFLEEKGVGDVFMVSGGTAMHLVDALGLAQKIRYVACHHEQACAMAAQSYAKMTGRLGVALVTSGPGCTNTITGLAGAHLDSTPCLFLSGQSKRAQTVHNSGVPGLRQFGVQEVNILPIVASITKYAVMVNEPETIRYHLEKALFLAQSGRPGPVWIDVPLDVQSANVEEAALRGFDPSELGLYAKTDPESEEIDFAAAVLAQAKRPVLVAGHGIRLANACPELVTLAERCAIPVVTSYLGIDVIETGHQNYIGRIGTKGTRAGNLALQNSDLVLSVGSRLSVSSVGHEYALFAREAKVIVVDIDPSEHKKKTIRIDRLIEADAGVFLRRLLQKIHKSASKSRAGWLDRCRKWKAAYPVCLPEYAKAKGGIHYYHFVDRLSRRLPAGIPVLADAGSAFYVVAQTICLKKGQRYITSGAFGEMGFNLPAAVGACIGNGRKPVVVVTGEGSFQMNLQELQTIVHYKLPVKVFVINNNGYVSIRNTQKAFFKGHLVGEGPQSGVSFPDTGKIARAYGIKFLRAQKAAELAKVIDSALAFRGPVVCEIMSLQDQTVAPTTSTMVTPRGVLVSKPLEDMYPFLDRKEFLANMIVKPVPE